MSEYWLAREGQQFGPYSADDLRRMLTDGRATATDAVWKEGMAGWEPLSQVILVSSAPPPPPPPPLGSTAGAQTARSYTGQIASNFVPPSLPWGLIVLFSMLTLGLFYWIWCLREASFVKKIDQGTSSLLLMVFAVITQIIVDILYFAAVSTNDGDARVGLFAIEIFVYLVSAIFFLVAVFQMRRSLLNHYNVAEPIALRLSGGMTFFFNVLYFQYHFNRIARWKQTGHLEPQ